MNMKFLMVVIMTAFCAAFSMPAFGQEAAVSETAPAAEAVVEEATEAFDEEAVLDDEELPYYSYGTVVSATADLLTVKEVIYEEDAEKEINVDYNLNADTELEGYAALADIKANDEIEIYYLEADNVKTATLVIKNEYSEEDFEDYGDEYLEEGAGDEAVIEEPVVETQTNTIE